MGQWWWYVRTAVVRGRHVRSEHWRRYVRAAEFGRRPVRWCAEQRWWLVRPEHRRRPLRTAEHRRRTVRCPEQWRRLVRAAGRGWRFVRGQHWRGLVRAVVLSPISMRRNKK